jgi:4-aminobutyrate aminotransferase/(S)-3-amino-2-methylpropionate transaminase
MSTPSDLQRRREAAVPCGVASAHGVFAARAQGAELWDTQGRRYLDFAGGISVVNTGHLHPRVLAAVEGQLKQLWHACFQVTPYESYIAVAERLNALAPGQAPKKTILFSTGAEAVENALKIARHYTGRPAVIAFAGGFHGRTLATLSLTGKVQPYKSGFGPTLPDVFHVPFPMRYHGITPADSLAAIEQLFKHSVDPSRVAALIIEPVLGEGGFYVAGSDFLRALRQLCDRHGIVLILDEIQSGCARTGRFFAHEHAGIEADLITVAKSIAGGLPLSALIGKTPIMDSPPPGGLGGTFAGSPVACAAALAVLDVIRDDALTTKAQQIGAQIEARLLALQSECRAIGEVRGLGAMLAFELVREGQPEQPDADAARAIVQAAARRGLLLLACGYYGNVVRLLPPLTLTDAQLTEGMDLLAAAVVEACASTAAV